MNVTNSPFKALFDLRIPGLREDSFMLRNAGGVVVSITDPRAMFTLVDNAAVSPVAAEAEERLRRAIYAVGEKEANRCMSECGASRPSSS